MKIGLISDTHSAGSGRDLPLQILEAFKGVDLVLHSGDLECLGVLDYLESVAPVLAVRGYEDPTEPGDRLAGVTRVVEAGGVSIGMIHDIQWPGPRLATSPDGTSLELPAGDGKEFMSRKFRRPVEVVQFGDTHEELIICWDGVLIINPGSPTYPGSQHKPGTLGTVGFLEIEPDYLEASLLHLETGQTSQALKVPRQ